LAQFTDDELPAPLIHGNTQSFFVIHLRPRFYS
jgi:hypothetical protein